MKSKYLLKEDSYLQLLLLSGDCGRIRPLPLSWLHAQQGCEPLGVVFN